MYNIGVLDGQIERHTPGRSKCIAANLTSRNPSQPVAVVHDDHSEKRGDTRAQGVTGENHPVVGAVLEPQALECFGLLVEEPNCGLEKAVVDVTAVEHLHTEAVVEEELVVALLDEVEAADGEDDLAVVVVGVDEVGRGAAMGLLVGDAFDDPVGVEAVASVWGELRVAEIGLVDGEDEAADVGDGGELVVGGAGPGGAVVGADVGAALPRPTHAPEDHHALHAARDRHFWNEK